MNGASLVGYAILRANFDAGRPNYLDNFLEFVVDAVRVANPTPQTPEAVSAHVAQKFGLTIPPLVARNIMRRAQRLERLQDAGGGSFACSPLELAQPRSVSAEHDKFIRQENQVADRLIEYADSSGFATRGTMNREQAAALIGAYMDAHALPLLRNAVQGATAPKRLEPGENYLVSCFVADAHDGDDDLFTRLVEIAKGATLAAVLRMDVSSLQASLKHLVVYLDAPLLIDVLGHHGETAKAASRDLLSLARGLGAKTAAFSHTVREAKSILAAAQTQLRNGQRVSETFRAAVYFLEVGMSPSDIEIAIQRFDDELVALGIGEREKPNTYHSYGLDESQLEENIRRAIHYANEVALRYDVDSISAVHRLREGRPGETLERAKTIFVTTNYELVTAANRSREDVHEYPLALLDSTLASLLWVRSPTLADSLPAKKVAATAWAGMQPDPARWSQYLAEVDRLEERGALSRDDAILLRLSSESKRELMRETNGEPDQFSSVPPSKLVELVKENLAEPLRDQVKELQEEARATVDASAASIAAAQADASHERAENSLLRQRLDRAEAANAAARDEDHQRRARLWTKASRDARRAVSAGVWIVGAATFLLGLFPLISPNLGWRVQEPWPTVLALGGALVLIVGLLTQVVGGSLREWFARLEKPLAVRLHRSRLEKLGMTPGEEIGVRANSELAESPR